MLKGVVHAGVCQQTQQLLPKLASVTGAFWCLLSLTLVQTLTRGFVVRPHLYVVAEQNESKP